MRSASRRKGHSKSLALQKHTLHCSTLITIIIMPKKFNIFWPDDDKSIRKYRFFIGAFSVDETDLPKCIHKRVFSKEKKFQ